MGESIEEMMLKFDLMKILDRLNEKRAELADEQIKQYGTPEQVEKRAKRRAIQLAFVGKVVPPGPWDEDMDNHPEIDYWIPLGDGYCCVLHRMVDMRWQIGVTVPHWTHWSYGMKLDREHPDISYHKGLEVGRPNKYPVRPLVVCTCLLNKYNNWMPLSTPDKGEYLTYEMAIEEAKILMEFLKKNPYEEE